MALTPRGRALRWLTRHRGITEQPANSNTDRRQDGIRAAQLRLGRWLVGLAWCGVWAANAALAGGVAIPRPYRWASVQLIHEDAAAGRNGFLKWVDNRPGEERGKVMRGDLVTFFGFAHVETFREFVHDRGGRVIALVTDGGNTSAGAGGSQNNGGGSYRRVRPVGDADGFARVNYPEPGAAARLLSAAWAWRPRPTIEVGPEGGAVDGAGVVSPAQADPPIGAW